MRPKFGQQGRSRRKRRSRQFFGLSAAEQPVFLELEGARDVCRAAHTVGKKEGRHAVCAVNSWRGFDGCALPALLCSAGF